MSKEKKEYHLQALNALRVKKILHWGQENMRFGNKKINEDYHLIVQK